MLHLKNVNVREEITSRYYNLLITLPILNKKSAKSLFDGYVNAVEHIFGNFISFDLSISKMRKRFSNPRLIIPNMKIEISFLQRPNNKKEFGISTNRFLSFGLIENKLFQCQKMNS